MIDGPYGVHEPHARAASGRHRARLATIARAAFSLALLGVLASRVDAGAALGTIAATPKLPLAAALALLLLAQLAAAARLHLLAAVPAITIDLATAVRLTFLGLFTSNFLPGTVAGDAVKALAIARSAPGRGTAIAALLVTDRLLGLVAFLLVLPTVLAAPPLLAGAGAGPTPALALLLLLLLAAAVLAVLALRSRRPRLVAFRAALADHAVRPARLALALALALLGVLLGALAVLVVARALRLDVPFLALLAALAITYLVALVPVALNGLGLSEASLVLCLTRLGAATAPAVAAAILVRVLTVAASLPGAFVLLAPAARTRPPATPPPRS